jgi:RimJ/RimL family protein N-acetyltransferase
VAVGYNGFVGRTCCMHVVVNKPEHMTRSIVREAFEYPFLRAGCEAVIGLVDSVNQAAIDFDKRLGFVEVARIAHAGLEGDLVILRMLRSECRWLRPH